jgi:hypothetical protein
LRYAAYDPSVFDLRNAGLLWGKLSELPELQSASRHDEAPVGIRRWFLSFRNVKLPAFVDAVLKDGFVGENERVTPQVERAPPGTISRDEEETE